jgi:EAL domain-containing protein (putative c-di-GMP-specific phosphodiesterase class I)
MSCSRCTSIPKLFFSKANVFVNLPTHHHVELFESTLQENQYTYEVLEEGYLIYEVNFEPYISFLNTVVFNSVEQKDVKILPLKREEMLSFSSLKHYRSLKDWTMLYKGREVVSIIEGERIKTLFQPIIHGKTGEIYGYEALSRGVLEDGSIMNPEKLFSWAKDMDLMFFLDRICREISIRAASKHKINKKIFINFVPTAIYVPSLCLQSTVKALEEENIPPEQVVFEVVESEKVVDFEHLNLILDYYKSRGVSTALDDIGSGYADIEALLKLKPDYMKIDMSIIRDIHIDEKKQRLLDKFIENGKKVGSMILAEGVETLDEYGYLQTKDIDLMQGYLFGKPEEVPATIIQFS